MYSFPKISAETGDIEFRATKSSKISEVRQALGLDVGDKIPHSKIKSLRLFGSIPGSNSSVKVILKKIL